MARSTAVRAARSLRGIIVARGTGLAWVEETRFMHRARLFALTAAFLTLGVGAVAVPAPALAQSSDALQADRARLRAQLDKVNAEIDALKRASGSVRDDYRLRARLADAESLARRLMDIEARLGIRVDGAPRFQPPPTAAPTDSPADLDAKADILADQSRRVRAQAEAFARRATDLKGRQELRRRAADLDRDPFAPMEGSKRRVPSSSGSGTVTPSPNQGAAAPNTSSGSGLVPGRNDATGNNTGITTNVGATNIGTPASTQLRDLLDTATLMDIRRLETSGAAGASPQALERAAAALRARADWLDGQSRAMRAKAQAK
jgi:cell division protein FtsB